MTTADILSRVLEVAQLVEAPTAVGMELKTLADDLAEKIRQETAAERGQGSAAATVRRMLKNAAKGDCPVLGYAWNDADGKQITTDGYRAFCLVDPLPLPEKPDDLKAPDISNLVKDAAQRENIPLSVPDRKELKAFITIEKAEKGRKHSPLWDFGLGLPLVNAEYLLDLLTVLPAAKLYAAKAAPIVSTLYAIEEGEKGQDSNEAILLPVRSNAKLEAAKRAQAAQNILANARAERPNQPTISLDAFAVIVDAANNAA